MQKLYELLRQWWYEIKEDEKREGDDSEKINPARL